MKNYTAEQLKSLSREELIEEIFAANPKHLTVSPPYNDLTRSVIERKSWQQIPGNPRTGGNEADDRERTGTRV